MEKKRVFLVSGITIMLFISIFSYLYINSLIPITDKNDTISREVNAIEKTENGTVPFVVYVPNDKTGLLDPIMADVGTRGDIYNNIMKSIVKSSKDNFKGKYKLKDAKKKGNLLTLKFDDGFKDESKYNLKVMSIVNTFSEITGVEYVEIYSGKDLLSIKGVNKFTRKSNLISAEKFNSPEEAVRKQMEYEQRGEFLKAYLIMSYKHSPNRKMYYDYISEMKEIKSLGFLNGDFKIKNYNIDKNEASVNVEFINVSKQGESINTSIVEVKCVKIDGTWLVNWA